MVRCDTLGRHFFCDLILSRLLLAALLAIGRAHPRLLLAQDEHNICDGSSGPNVPQIAALPAAWVGTDVTPSSEFFQEYRPLGDISSFLNKLHDSSPNLVVIKQIGISTEGRPIRIFEIADASNGSPPLSDRPVIYLQAGLHAREWIAPAVILFIASALVRDFAAEMQEVKEMLRTFVVVLNPVANPDGYTWSWESNRMWRKTRNTAVPDSGCVGVDANRNWDFMWRETPSWAYRQELKDPCSNVYAGPTPFSEPETQSVATYLRGIHRGGLGETGGGGAGYVGAFLDLHSYAQMLLPPWGYTDSAPPDAAYQNGLTTAMVNAIRDASGREFQAGAGLLDSDPGTAPDWAYGELGVRASLTVELEGSYYHSAGFCWPRESIVSVGSEQVTVLLALGRYLKEHGSVPSRVVGNYKDVEWGTTARASAEDVASPSSSGGSTHPASGAVPDTRKSPNSTDTASFTKIRSTPFCILLGVIGSARFFV